MMKKNSKIVTNSGRLVDLVKPDPETIDIMDIAHGLSMTCRWAGQCRLYYSVAQHSFLVSSLVPGTDALWGLLHDAAEAYITDLPRPLKLELPKYRAIEKNLMGAICSRFGLVPEMPSIVKKADNIMLATELKQVMANVPVEIDFGEKPIAIEIVPVDQELAKKIFLEKFEDLTR